LNTFLYNWKEEINDEVNKRKRDTSTTTTTTAATTIPKPSIRDNNNDVYASDNTNNNDPLFDRRIDLVTEGIGAFFDSKLRELPYNNALTIIDYILSMKNEINLSDGYRKLNIYALYSISKFFNNGKPYKELLRDDILQFLDSLRRV
jgi:hypothetical protein